MRAIRLLLAFYFDSCAQAASLSEWHSSSGGGWVAGGLGLRLGLALSGSLRGRMLLQIAEAKPLETDSEDTPRNLKIGNPGP